ncbi:AraC family transcriptional regulator [Mariniluteicoccus flavus]
MAVVTSSLRTADVDLARTEVARLFCPHHLRPGPRGVRLRLNARRGESVGIVELDYGFPVRIDPGQLERFYLVQVPLAGRALIAHGGKEFTSTPSIAAVLSPDDPVAMVWGERNPQLLCWLERSAVDAAASRLAGDALRGVRFAPLMDLTAPTAAAWVASLRRAARTPGSPDETSLITSLLLAQPHNHSAKVASPGPPMSSVRRAMAYMRAHVADPVTLPEVAVATGVGVRALQKGFRAEVDATPMEWLRDLRLDLARDQLAAADAHLATVTGIATGLGIQHLGRFAVHYRDRFGESPSQTLARAASSG